jgi:hypothetical protein
LHYLWGAGILNRVYPHILQLLREYGESIDGAIPTSRFTPSELDVSVHRSAKGLNVPVGQTVFPHDLCWGIDDGLFSCLTQLEYGRRVRDGPHERKTEDGRDGEVVGRSINRKEGVMVKEGHGRVVVYGACVSVALDEHVKKD